MESMGEGSNVKAKCWTRMRWERVRKKSEVTRIKEFAADGTSCAHLIPAQTICQIVRQNCFCMGNWSVSEPRRKSESSISGISYQTFYYN